MEDELTGIRLREKVLAQPWHQKKSAQTNPEKRWNEDPSGFDTLRQDTPIRVPQPCKAVLESLLKTHERILRLPATLIEFEHVHHQRRHQRSRKNVGSEHRKNHGLRQWNEEISCYPAEQKQRHKDDADAQCRDECRYGDLLGAIQNGLPNLGLVTFFKDAVDVFDLNRGVVHQNPNCQR